MEHYDPELAQRVWERVQHREESEDLSPALLALLTESAADAAALVKLQRQVSGQKWALIGQLVRKKRGCAACLLGILRMSATSPPPVISAAEGGTAAQVLRRCLGHTLRSIRQYDRLSGHPEYGPVFASLARQETDLAETLLQLLGSL